MLVSTFSVTRSLCQNKNKTRTSGQEDIKPLVESERLNLDGFIFRRDFNPAASFARKIFRHYGTHREKDRETKKQ